MKFKSESYKESKCCNSDCHYEYLSTEQEPCWGEVEVVGEDCTEDFSECWWIHACKGHIKFYDYGSNETYIKEDANEIS